MELDTRKIVLILKKEFIQLRQQRGLVLSAFFLPVVLTLIPLAVTFGISQAPLDSLNGVDQLLELAKSNPSLQGLSTLELVQAAIGQPISVILLMLPVILPSIIASYSIVGEKVSGTLEPLLATPTTTLELLLAKILTSLVPAVAITWFFGAIYVAGIALISRSPAVFAAIVSPSWFILMLLCGPLLALMTIAATVAASSRASDPRSAQQISAVVIIPVVLVLAGQIAGLLVLSPVFALLLAAGLATLAAIMTWFATRLFDREAILIRWR
jgi:ABC-2 type transport system permease protein